MAPVKAEIVDFNLVFTGLIADEFLKISIAWGKERAARAF
jgi:hypothetical protein